MKIETKFNIGDEVYIMKDNRVQELEINSISIKVKMNHYFCNEQTINYGIVKENKHYNQSELYKTKKDLLDSL